MAIDLQTTAADFMPEISERFVSVRLKFPVTEFELVVRRVEERLCYERDDILKNLYPIITDRIKVFGTITDTCEHGDIWITIALRDGVKDDADLMLQAVAESCRIFWNRYNFRYMKEVKELTKKD